MQFIFLTTAICPAIIFALLTFAPGFKGSKIAMFFSAIWFALIQAGIATLAYSYTALLMFWCGIGAGAHASSLNINTFYVGAFIALFLTTLIELSIFLGILIAIQLLKKQPIWSIIVAAVIITACDGAVLALTTPLEKASHKVFHHHIGFIDRDGNLAIPATFTLAGDFKNGVALVQTPEEIIPLDSEAGFSTQFCRNIRECNFIDKAGKTILEKISTTATNFSDGVIPYYDSAQAKFGYIDIHGKVLIQPAFQQANDFNNGLATVKVPKFQTEWACIDKTGKVLWTVENATEMTALINGAAKVTPVADPSNPYYVNSKGKKLAGQVLLKLDRSFFEAPPDGTLYTKAIVDPIKIGSNFEVLPPSDGFWLAKFVPVPDGSYQPEELNQFGGMKNVDNWTFTNDTKKMPFGKMAFTDARSFKEKKAAVQVSTRGGVAWAFVDTAGHWLTKPIFTSAASFSDGRALVSVGGSEKPGQSEPSFGFIDDKGNVVIPTKYVYARSFSEGLAAVEID